MKFTALINYITSFLVCLAITSFAQQQQLDTLRKKFDSHRKNNLTEKIYLHTDRAAYLTGETLWFKAYVTDGALHQSINLSKVAYVEIIDKDSAPVVQAKISLTNGIGHGSLYLPATINSGNYIVRAYTNWMKNAPTDYFFHQPITIINTFKKIETEVNTSPSKIDAQFFPEGGNLLAGVNTKIGFRVTNQHGKGINFTGVIVTNNQDTVATFSPLTFGIGHFLLTPESSTTYKAIIREENGKTSTHTLPVVNDLGYAMTLLDDGTQLQLTVTSTDAQSVNLPVYLFVHARNQITVATYKPIQQGTATFTIPKAKLAEGISHFTIFDSELAPICERLYFQYPDKDLSITLTTNAQRFTARKNVQLTVNTSTAAKSVAADLSVSVHRIDSLPQSTPGIYPYHWLTSDLKGTIESPEYYFTSTSPKRIEAIDNLMLTHGWRRFIWNDVLQQKIKPTYLPEYRGHIIQGIVKDANGEPAPGKLTYLSAPGKMIRLYASYSNNAGEVLFEMQNFKGTSSIIVQHNNKRDSTYKISITSPFSTQPTAYLPSLFTLSPAHEKSILERSVAMQVQDIFYDERSIPQRPSDSTTFYGMADETYYLDDYTRFPVMEEVMREYVPGVWVRKRKDGFHFMVIDKVSKAVFNETPLILLDGVPIFDEDEIMNFNPLLIQKLEVMTRRYYLGPGNYTGIVSYRTYTGDLAGFPLHPKSVQLNYEGLQLQREFYTPKYENVSQRAGRMPDQRTLLYWNPDVATNTQGTQTINFYTSDVPGTYQVTVQGLTPQGISGTGTTTFVVNEELP